MNLPEGLWLQLSANYREELLSLHQEWGESPEGAPGIVLAPVTTHENLVETARACTDGRVYLDPCGYLLDRQPTARARRYFPWLAGLHEDDESEPSPADSVAEPGGESVEAADPPAQRRPESQDEWLSWMRRSIDHAAALFVQAKRTPSVLVSPCPMIESMVTDRDIDAVCETYTTLAADYSLLIPSFCVGSEFTRTEQGITRLANALIGLAPPAVLLRCFQSQLPPITDRLYLEGLREIVQACSSNGITVLLPNSGWVGWLARSWGDVHYSCGATQSSWFDRVPTPMNPPPQIDRIHDVQLITRREYDLGPSLEEVDGYAACGCESCVEMAGVFTKPLARMHQLRAARAEDLALSGVPAGTRRLLIKGRLADASQMWERLPAPLRQDIDGGHLALWAGLA